ncbi:MAG: hypothetical protein EHM42_11350, partial [Planctomycetaceae bacterium]
MSNFPQRSPTSSTLAEIDRLIDGVVELAQSETSESRFLGELLSAAVQGIAGRGGFVWPVPVVAGGMPLARVGITTGETGGANLPSEKLPSELAEHAGHRELLSRVSRDRVPALVLPGRQDANSVDVSNPTDSVLLVAPIGAVDTPCDAVLEVLISSGGSPTTQQSALEVVSAFSEAARLWYNRKRLDELRQRVARADKWDELIALVHGSLDPVAVAFAVANEGRSFLGCDRLSVVSLDRQRARLLAASGQDAIDRRAPLTTALEELARVVAAAREPVSYPAENARLPPQISTAAQAVCDLASARELLIWPLIRGSDADASSTDPQTPAGKSQRAEPE